MKLLKPIGVFALLGISAFLGLNWNLFEDNINPLLYRRGPDMRARLEEFSEKMSKTEVIRRLPDVPLSCEDNSSALSLGNHVCYSNIASYSGVRALRVVFFFLDGHLSNIKIDVPWWSHGQMAKQLVKDHGAPTGGQDYPLDGVRLVGWKLVNGNILYNRDRDRNPLMWNTVQWVSPSAAEKLGGLFVPTSKSF